MLGCILTDGQGRLKTLTLSKATYQFTLQQLSMCLTAPKLSRLACASGASVSVAAHCHMPIYPPTPPTPNLVTFRIRHKIQMFSLVWKPLEN